MTRPARIVLKVAVWGACLAPLAVLGWWVLADDLTANPISFITNHLGDWTFRILLSSLAMTPLRILTGWGWPALLRRLLGLFAFTYALLHGSVWVLVDHFFNWGQMLEDLVKRPYITAGMLALTLMLPLALTSTAGMVRRLGARNWKRLHRLVYAVGVCAALHFLWLAKVGRQDQYVYAAILALLLAIRLGAWARRRVRVSRTQTAEARRSHAAFEGERSRVAAHSGSPRASNALRLRTPTSGHPRSDPAPRHPFQ